MWPSEVAAPSPLASAEADRILSSDLSQSAAARAGDLLASLANPVDDVRGTAEYRKVLIPRMLSRALNDAVAASRSCSMSETATVILNVNGAAFARGPSHTIRCSPSFAISSSLPVPSAAAIRRLRRVHGVVRGRPVRSCLSLALDCEDKRIDTIEGLSDQPAHAGAPALRSLPAGAFQCGFCTPGMLVAAFALLMNDRRPSEADIRRTLSGNLCRCTGYKKIVEAVLGAARRIAGGRLWREQTRCPRRGRQAGASARGPGKVCGSAKFIADLYRPNMLYGAVLQSPHAHARILNYDLSQALAISGVRAIVTGDDLQDAWRMGAFIKDEHALAKGKVRYIGEPVAAVAADTEAIAVQGRRRDYRHL